MRMTVIPTVIDMLGTILKGLEIGKQIESIQTTIVKISQNTEKRPEDSSERPLVNASVKGMK